MPEVDTSPEVVLSHLDQLPTLSAVVVRILQLTDDDESTTGEVVQMLRADQSLTAKILSVTNSAAMGVRGRVTTLDKAVPLLGFAAVRSIVLATGVFDCFSRRTNASAGNTFDLVEFWKHSLAVACAARRLAKLSPGGNVDAEDAFVAGLLHDLGKVALDTVFPKAYDRIVSQTNHSRGDIADAERTVLGADHTVAGRRLAERWRLPASLQRAIWLHHLAPEALPASVTAPELIGVVALGDTIAREQRIGYSGNYVFCDHSPRLAERLGFPPEAVDVVVKTLAGDVAAQAALLGLDGETAEGLYVQAMTRANAELGRLNADLMSGNRRLATGARYFNAITRFERELSDWSDPAAVIAAVAEAGADALQRPRLAAFGLRQNLTAVDVTWVGEEDDERGHDTRNTPIELLSWISEASELADQLVYSRATAGARFAGGGILRPIRPGGRGC